MAAFSRFLMVLVFFHFSSKRECYNGDYGHMEIEYPYHKDGATSWAEFSFGMKLSSLEELGEARFDGRRRGGD
ncbi:hypothetical protein PanWU01x14_355500 [Parasponia andersonii]|uniref:Uncharacterized protein n=1 Tax=Parasponia andersonii TaxID=3476 RepID=A0A2P5A9A7_PARAD|nr:hypothetical protein PanWU01x14_355500 [Parasponia andersonii]